MKCVRVSIQRPACGPVVALLLAGTVLGASAVFAARPEASPGELFPDVPDRRPPAKTPSPKPVETFPRFERPTPAQIGAAVQAARKQALDFAAAQKLVLAEVPSEHLMIFTDLPAAGREAIRRTLENAYTAAARPMQVGPGEMLFVGKPVVYVLASRAGYEALAGRDKVDLPAYLTGPADCPRLVAGATVEDKAWIVPTRRLLAGAMLARFRSARPLPAWLTVGLLESAAAEPCAGGGGGAATRPAEAPAAGAVVGMAAWAKVAETRPAASASPACAPSPGRTPPEVRAAARTLGSIQRLLEDTSVSSEVAPAAQALVEMLMARDPKAFGELLRCLKDGLPTREALQKTYQLDYAKLDAAWQAYVR